MPHFSHFQNQIGKMEHFRKNEHKKAGHFEKIHVINFKKENEMGHFRKKLHKPSREKYIFSMLFGAFHYTPRSDLIN